MGGEPTLLLERLAAIPNAAHFINAPPVLLSSLQPMVRIFKVLYPTPDSKGEDIELKFECPDCKRGNIEQNPNGSEFCRDCGWKNY